MAAVDISIKLHSIDAEESVLGSILIDPDSMGEIVGMLSSDDFYHDTCRIIYGAMIAAREKGSSPNQIVVANELQAMNQLSNCGGAAFLSHLIVVVATSLDIKIYAAEVKKFSMYRQVVGVADMTIKMVSEQKMSIEQMLDTIDNSVESIRSKWSPESRKLELGKPRLVQTSPPKYTWNVNGKDLHLSLREITEWGRFKNRVIAELNFVPEKPKNWDDTINALITHSSKQEAPIDASDEQQLKIAIMSWIERKPEGTEITDIQNGSHAIREVVCKENFWVKTSYYFFQSTALLKELRGGTNKYTIKAPDLWDYCEKWGGIRHEIRLKGSDPAKLWGLPLSFLEPTTTIMPTVITEAPNDF